MYPYALEAGVDVHMFWQLSFGEVMDITEAYNRRERRLFKDAVRQQFLLAEIITRFMTREKQEPIPRPWEYYPELFADDKKAAETLEEEKQLQEMKERRRRYASEVNRRRRGG